MDDEPEDPRDEALDIPSKEASDRRVPPHDGHHAQIVVFEGSIRPPVKSVDDRPGGMFALLHGHLRDLWVGRSVRTFQIGGIPDDEDLGVLHEMEGGRHLDPAAPNDG